MPELRRSGRVVCTVRFFDQTSCVDIEDIVNALAHEHGDVTFKELRWWVGTP